MSHPPTQWRANGRPKRGPRPAPPPRQSPGQQHAVARQRHAEAAVVPHLPVDARVVEQLPGPDHEGTLPAAGAGPSTSPAFTGRGSSGATEADAWIGISWERHRSLFFLDFGCNSESSLGLACSKQTRIYYACFHSRHYQKNCSIFSLLVIKVSSPLGHPRKQYRGAPPKSPKGALPGHCKLLAAFFVGRKIIFVLCDD